MICSRFILSIFLVFTAVIVHLIVFFWVCAPYSRCMFRRFVLTYCLHQYSLGLRQYVFPKLQITRLLQGAEDSKLILRFLHVYIPVYCEILCKFSYLPLIFAMLIISTCMLYFERDLYKSRVCRTFVSWMLCVSASYS